MNVRWLPCRMVLFRPEVEPVRPEAMNCGHADLATMSAGGHHDVARFAAAHSGGQRLAGVRLFTGEIIGMGGACWADVTAHKSQLSRDVIDGTAIFDGSNLVPVMWPVGYTARMAGEQVEVLDTRGQVVATTGRLYILQGRFHAGTFQLCRGGDPEEVTP